jgi:hypothetical protein
MISNATVSGSRPAGIIPALLYILVLTGSHTTRCRGQVSATGSRDVLAAGTSPADIGVVGGPATGGGTVTPCEEPSSKTKHARVQQVQQPRLWK